MEIGPYSSVQLDFEMMMMIMQVTIGFQLNIHQWDIQLESYIQFQWESHRNDL